MSHSRVTHPIEAGIVAATIALAGLVVAGVFVVFTVVVAFRIVATAAGVIMRFDGRWVGCSLRFA